MALSRSKRSLTIARHRTSVSLEDEFWEALADFARSDGKSVAALIGEIDRRRSERPPPRPGLSGAIRLYVLERLRRGTR
ncbi:MAG TPA: ribbon-helix-helix domain-containing protein [Methyloceanibacter sp.]|nr:ribbon-helix-helix domain-containing protein [Methyloceanibacter sp.]